MALIEMTAAGLYCRAGDFHIDPWRPVPCAVLTHAHADHARAGSARYIAASEGLELLRLRLGSLAPIEGRAYGERFDLGSARVSLHPAGHILGSAQVRIEADGEVWVVTGDYKRDPDPTCAPFEPVRCDVLVTEATFALPVYRWPPAERVALEVLAWWDACVRERIPAVLCCYALGKAQRLLAELARLTDRPVHLHGAMAALVDAYRQAGVPMLPTRPVSDAPRGRDFAGELILAPPSAAGTPWMRRFRDASLGFASGWMQVRGHRRRRGYDLGFVLSDHADWPGLLATVHDSGARRVLAMHGDADAFVRHLRESGIDAAALRSDFARDEGSA
jgi:putative mRNA 3-end processing factor